MQHVHTLTHTFRLKSLIYTFISSASQYRQYYVSCGFSKNYIHIYWHNFTNDSELTEIYGVTAFCTQELEGVDAHTYAHSHSHMRTITAWRYSAIVVIGNDETWRVSAACEWDSLCCSGEEGLTPHHLPLSEQVCVRAASWELQPIHHVCLCSYALWHMCLPSTCVSAVEPIGVLLCQGLGRLHPTPPTRPLRFCQWRTSSHGNTPKSVVRYSKVMRDFFLDPIMRAARVETNSPEIHVKFAHAFRFSSWILLCSANTLKVWILYLTLNLCSHFLLDWNLLMPQVGLF